jgi:hypothetical protein
MFYMEPYLIEYLSLYATEPVDPWNPGDGVNFRSDVSYVWWQHYQSFGATWRNHSIIIK